MARSEGAEGPAQHLADAIAAAFSRAQQPGEHLAVHAPKLAIEPHLQILRRHRRSLLLRLEYPHRPALEDYVNRAPRLGLRRSINLRIGIRAPAATSGGAARHDRDRVERVDRLAVLIVGRPFDADDALRLRSGGDEV